MTPEIIDNIVKQKTPRPKTKVLTKQVRFFLSPSDYANLQKAAEIDKRGTVAQFCRLYVMRCVSGILIQSEVPEMIKLAKQMKDLSEKEHPDLFK